MTRRTLLYIIVLLTVSGISFLPAQTDSVRISAAGKNGYVHSLSVNGVRFLSVKDAAAFIGLDVYENAPLKKIEVKTQASVIKFTAENYFIVITNTESKRQRVQQLTAPVKFNAGSYLVKSDELIGLLRASADASLLVEEAPAVIVDSTPKVPVVAGYSLEEKTNGTMFRIHLTAKVNEFSRMLQTGEWIYVTLVGAQCDTMLFDTTFASGIIRRVKPVQSETALQLSLQIRGKVAQSEIVQDQLTDDIILTLIPQSEEKKEPKIDSSAIRRQQAERAHQQVVKSIEKQKKKWKLDVVVIDPGHGGHDPGAIGLIGTREKDITLGIALKLGEMIKKEMPDVNVIYTRKTDRFVELYRRGQIANENEGKLFISIHCNSTERKPSSANGFEIYLLRPGKTEDAIRIAEKENDVVKLEKDYEDRYQELTEENFIILTMAQSSYVKASERFAEMLEETMSAQMEGQRQPVKQAGFYVLVGASMPNVLVETGYLSNVKDERFLRSPAGQKKIAAAIVNGLKGYKNEYEDENQ